MSLGMSDETGDWGGYPEWQAHCLLAMQTHMLARKMWLPTPQPETQAAWDNYKGKLSAETIAKSAEIMARCPHGLAVLAGKTVLTVG